MRQSAWIHPNELRNFPHPDLKTIDQLWQHWSGGKFGFSVQKKVWKKCGSPTDNSEDWNRFCVEVGWQDTATSRDLEYDELKANPDFSPTGELPFLWCACLGLVGGGGVLFSRIKTYKLR